MRFGSCVLALVLAAACACSRRPHVAVRGDGGPAVVVIDARGPRARHADAGVLSASGRAWRDASAALLVDEKEPDDDTGHAQPFEYPKGIHGTLVPGAGGRPDVDLYQWNPSGEGRQSARIVLDGPPDATLDVLDGGGEPTLRAQPGERVIANLAVTPGEVLFLRVRGGRVAAPVVPVVPAPAPGQLPGSTAGSALPAIAADSRLTVRTQPLQPGDEEEPNDAANRANPVLPAVEQTGYYGRAHDEDWLRLPDGMPEGSTLRIELSPVEGVVPSVRVRDATGALLVESKGGRGDELRLRNAPAPSGGLIVVRAESARNLEVPWRLRFAVEPPLVSVELEPNGTPASANPLDLEGGRAHVSAFLWPGDVDLYRVHTGGAALVEATLESPTGVEARVELASPTGAALKPATGTDSRGRRLRALPVDGELLLRVSARPRDTAFEAPYTLSVTLVPGAVSRTDEPTLPAAPPAAP